ncbi:MAG: C1 family peptidase [Candidatus Omnitrophota bacterium]
MSGLGYIQDKFDSRDYLMRAYLPVARLPKSVDYAPKASPVRDQGIEGTCVAFATATGMKEYQELLDYEKLIVLSPRFIYDECKKIDGMPDIEGTTLRVAMKVLKTKGVCRESFQPYGPYQRIKLRKGGVADAKKFRVITYARIININELRQSLYAKGPCVIGVEVFKGMMETKTGLVPMPKKNEQAQGGHAICAVGYDDKKKLIKFKNSWSAKWGKKGYGSLPYTYIEEHMIDAWSSVDIEDPNPLTLAKALGDGLKQDKVLAATVLLKEKKA